MSAEYPTDDAAEQLEIDEERAYQTGESIEIVPRPDADACGVWGCRHTEDLAAVDRPHNLTRVLCPRHVDDYVGAKIR